MSSRAGPRDIIQALCRGLKPSFCHLFHLRRHPTLEGGGRASEERPEPRGASVQIDGDLHTEHTYKGSGRRLLSFAT